MIKEEALLENLKQYFGFDRFKSQQEQIISSILNGNDTFVIMPTGGGKSLCYQLPAIMSKGTTIIISPLIALMKNQVDLVRSYSSSDTIAHFLNSSLSKTQIKQVKQDVLNGETKMLYVAPETLTKQENIEFFSSCNIAFVAIDEAHCISEWGHDFRPEYRKIRQMIDGISPELPLIALTATATPKVQLDIRKNLRMKNPNIYVSSFLRENLYYEMRPKGDKSATIRDIVKYIKSNQDGNSGIIYCQNRKTTEEVAELLNYNGINAAPYHAGLDAKLRSNTQDKFLKEDIDVIVATIAFGMGIDKPDVRFVLHYTMPKSMENYYQETGRAGRDGSRSDCIAYYAEEDLIKLERFLKDKPVAEREIGTQHIEEMGAYAETTDCRRGVILHYFGEKYDKSRCGNGECDNCKYERPKQTFTAEIELALQASKETHQQFKLKYLTELLSGTESRLVMEYGHQKHPLFGKGKEHPMHIWTSIYRFLLMEDYLKKDIEEYGVLKLTAKGEDYLQHPIELNVPLQIDYSKLTLGASESGKSSALDPNLYKALKDLRKKEAKKRNLPPFIIFQDPSLEEMATLYPITTDELANIKGVSKPKAIKFGKPFLKLIEDYTEENDIERHQDFSIKPAASRSANKIAIIQGVDKRIPLEDIARSRGLKFEELLSDIERIVSSGTRLSLDYYIQENIDEETQYIIVDYFMQCENDDLDLAMQELEEDDVEYDEVRLMRIKFYSENAN